MASSNDAQSCTNRSKDSGHRDYPPLLVRLHLEYGIWFSAPSVRKTLMTGLSSLMSDQDDQEAGTFALPGKAVGLRCTKRTVMAGGNLVIIL